MFGKKKRVVITIRQENALAVAATSHTRSWGRLKFLLLKILIRTSMVGFPTLDQSKVTLTIDARKGVADALQPSPNLQEKKEESR